VILGALALVTVLGVLVVGARRSGFDGGGSLGRWRDVAFGCAWQAWASLVAVITLSREPPRAAHRGNPDRDVNLLNIIAQIQPGLAWLGGLSRSGTPAWAR